MARAESASASAHSDSIKGLAQAVARPAYRRLLTAEPFLRRAVPVLIIAFLITLGIAAFVDVRERLRQAVAKSAEELDLVVTLTAERIDRLAAAEAGDAVTRAFRAFSRLEWPREPAGRMVLLTDASSTIIAVQPAINGYVGRKLNEAIGRDPATPAIVLRAGITDVTLTDGSRILLALRDINTPMGQLAITQRRAAVLAEWRADTTLAVTLFSATGFVVLMLGFAFLWQSRLMRETATIEDTVRSRIDTALNRGRCGLWDWDLAQRPHLLVAFDVRHPRARAALQAARLRRDQRAGASRRRAALRARQAAHRRRDASSIDRVFRMRHARGNWVWLRARCELVRQADEPQPASDRHRGRHHRADAPRGGKRDRRHAPARRDRDDLGSLRGVGRRQPAGAVQFQIQEPARPARRGVPSPARPTRKSPPPAASRSCACSSPARDARSPARAPSRRSWRTGAGCRSASAAPRTAASSRSAPTSPS